MKFVAAVVVSNVFVALAGCVPPASLVSPGDFGQTDKLASVQAKVDTVTSQIGGGTGFGGTTMSSYMQGMPQHMGFNANANLADPNGELTVHMVNSSSVACTVHLAYFDSNLGNADQTQDVNVPAGGDATVQIPCPEIMGAGSLESPGTAACRLANGTDVSNVMTLPAFLGTDYACGATYEMTLGPDVNNLTGTGNTSQLIMMSTAMTQRMGSMMQGQHGGMMQSP